MSIAIFTDRTAEDIKSELTSGGCSEDLLTVQTVSKTKYDSSETEYPINLLRNLAFSAVKTSHVVYADVDFWPTSDLLSIMSNETVKERLASDSKLAVVIPAFQLSSRYCEYMADCCEENVLAMPMNKDELIALIEMEAASAFDPQNQGGHGSTNYVMWKDQMAGKLEDLSCIESNRYEPYLTLRYCSEMPPFQERFVGYGKNKITVGYSLCLFFKCFLHTSSSIRYCLCTVGYATS
jgi:hypothetical protein